MFGKGLGSSGLAPCPLPTRGAVQCQQPVPTVSFSEQTSHPLAHMVLIPRFQLLQLIKRSCGTFNPFLMSLFPWSCCCSDDHSVYVTVNGGDSGPQLGSGAVEPKSPRSHGMHQYKLAGRLEIRRRLPAARAMKFNHSPCTCSEIK